MGTAPREATSMPSACRSSRASPLRNSPQTLWRGVGSRSISVTLRPLRASAMEAAQPATPPPRIRTSSCKELLLTHLDAQSIYGWIPLFLIDVEEDSLRGHSVQIVIFERVRTVPDRCTIW